MLKFTKIVLMIIPFRHRIYNLAENGLACTG